MKTASTKAIGFNLLMINAFIYIASSLYNPFQSAYFSSHGMDSVQIGILMTVSPIASILIQPLWAMASDRSGKRKTVLSLVVLGSAVSLFSFYLGNTFLTYLIASVLFALFITSIIPLSDAIIIREANKINFNFATIRMGGTLGFSLVVVLAGRILKVFPDSLFFMGFLGYMCLLIFVLRLPKDQELSREAAGYSKEAATGKKAGGILSIFTGKRILFVLAFAFLCQLGLSFYWSFLGVYLQDLGYGQSTLGLINCISALSEVPTLIIINRLIRKYGSMKLMFSACIILGLRILMIATGNLPIIFLAQLLHGTTYMTMYFSCAVYINDHVLQGRQSQGQSVLAIVQTGIGSIVGNIAGGYLVRLFGIPSAYAFMAGAIIASACVIGLLQLLYLRKGKAKPV
jgi:MFS family permease